MENNKPTDNSIVIKNARVHNLKNISVTIPRDKLIVITGLSGSGKSSLAFDTLYAEGQRRYAESLSSYARQFLGKMHKPEVDIITGIPPAIAIEQKVNTRNPRSTVGTSTEIYDYLRLLYSRIGRTYSPVSGEEVKKHSIEDVTDYLQSLSEGTKAVILAPFSRFRAKPLKEQLSILLREGITRIESKDELYLIDEIIDKPGVLDRKQPINIVVDRIIISHNEELVSRIADSVQTAFSEGDGICMIKVKEAEHYWTKTFSRRFEADGIIFDEPTEHFFSFNNPLGACPRCEGYGKVIGIDADAVIPDKSLSIYNDAVVCWKGEKLSQWKDDFIYAAGTSFPIHKPYYQLTEQQKDLLWNGKGKIQGIQSFFDYLESKKYKIQYRVMLAKYRGKTICPVCKGKRLRPETANVKINNYSIQDMVEMPAHQLLDTIEKLTLNEYEKKIAGRILIEIKSRLNFLLHTGLSYLTLNRLSSTLSGGESQRINLATSLASSLVGSLYILDEPSIGLHPRDSRLLISVLKQLRDIGNTVIVVEHDEEIIRAADELIDIGPLAGQNGGTIVYQGNTKNLENNSDSITAQYLTGAKKIELPAIRRKWNASIEIKGARENNLKDIDVSFPLQALTVVTGVSGSGKSSLVGQILYPALARKINGDMQKPGEHTAIGGDISRIGWVEFIDQNPIGRSSRSNPVTYIKAYDEIRKLFSEQQQSKINGFTPAHFSFNMPGGRCEECEGEGEIIIEMQFMADIRLVCDSCHGRRFKDDILEVKYKGLNIYDILELTVEEAMQLFATNTAKNSIERRITEKMQPLMDVGLGYIKLGQSSSTLSGGESQRIKLASFLGKGASGKPHLFIFDEPTTGLHFHDIKKLLASFNALIRNGHTILIIEHNTEIIKCADWVIDLGPEGGEKGGNILFAGTPEDLIKCKTSYTGQALLQKINI